MTKPWPIIADSTTPPLEMKVNASPSAFSTSAPVTMPSFPPGYLSCLNVSRALRGDDAQAGNIAHPLLVALVDAVAGGFGNKQMAKVGLCSLVSPHLDAYDTC